ncbi:MAG: hypothetical protein GWP19_00940 [Planctomycetia bacterium]|nr:hypothetical protein [Planctomycetia bacterium]
MTLNFGNNLFPPRGEVITSYDYSDFSNGLGYGIYYGFNNAGTLGISTKSLVYSGIRHINDAELDIDGTQTFTEILDKDFDITFNTPKNIKGDILVVVPFGIMNSEDAANTALDTFYKCELSIFHYNGSTETQMGSTITSEIKKVGDAITNTIYSHISTLKCNISTIKHFKIGETLRITLKIYIKHSGNGGGFREFIAGLGCDPQNRTDIGAGTDQGFPTDNQIITTNEPTKIEFHIPFKLEI